MGEAASVGVKSHKDLVAWQRAMDLVQAVYDLSATWPRTELYGLTSQIRRAAVSVPSNIAEGRGRATTREFLHHLSVAYGSLMEVETQMLLAERLGYLTSEQSAALSTRISEVARLLSGLVGALQRYRQARERERRRIREGPPPASGRDAYRTQDVLYLR